MVGDGDEVIGGEVVGLFWGFLVGNLVKVFWSCGCEFWFCEFDLLVGECDFFLCECGSLVVVSVSVVV